MTKTLLSLALLATLGIANAQQIYIYPHKGHGWMDTTVKYYPGVDSEGFTVPQVEISPAGLNPTQLAQFSAVVAYIVALGGGEWDATQIIAESAGIAVITPAVMDGETEITPAVTRLKLSLAVTVVDTADARRTKTELWSTESMPPTVREATIALWQFITEPLP